MSAQDELLLQMIMQAIPELSRGKYQPMDVGSEIANMSLLEDRLGNASNPLMAILNGTFDYGLLDPVSSFDEEAPDTALSDMYRNSGQYTELYNALDSALTPEQAALTQYNVEGNPPIDQDLMDGKNVHPRYAELLNIAESSKTEIAKKQSWTARRDAAPTTMSDTAKMFAEAGLSSERTEDSYFSPDIDRLRADRAEQESAFAAAQAKYDLVGKELRGPTDAFDGVVEERSLNSERPPAGAIQDSTSEEPKLIKEYQPPQTTDELDWVTGQGLQRDWSLTPVQQEYEDIVPGRNDRNSASPRITTYEQSEMGQKLAEGPQRVSPQVGNYGGNWRAADRDYEKSLKPRDATPAERQAIRSASDKDYDAWAKARMEERSVERERSSGRTIQRDQMMNRLASIIMGR